MVIESSQQSVKRGRGRPRKNPLPEEKVTHTSVVKHVEKNTPKKVSSHAHDSSLSWEEELAAFERRSNKSGILTLFVLLLWIALIGYGMYLKLHQADIEKTIDNQMENINTQTQKPPVAPTPAEKPSTNTPTPWQSTDNIINLYFDRINNWQFASVDELQDSSFKTLSTLRNYFNNTRLETFSKNTIWGIRIDSLVENKEDAVVQRNPLARAYDFQMVYTLKSDEKEYREPWRAYTVQKWTGIVVINGFVYQWTGIANSPFFQFTKFWIK